MKTFFIVVVFVDPSLVAFWTIRFRLQTIETATQFLMGMNGRKSHQYSLYFRRMGICGRREHVS